MFELGMADDVQSVLATLVMPTAVPVILKTYNLPPWLYRSTDHVDNDQDPEVSTTSELFALANGPSWTPISVNSCVVDGVRFKCEIVVELSINCLYVMLIVLVHMSSPMSARVPQEVTVAVMIVPHHTLCTYRCGVCFANKAKLKRKPIWRHGIGQAEYPRQDQQALSLKESRYLGLITYGKDVRSVPLYYPSWRIPKSGSGDHFPEMGSVIPFLMFNIIIVPCLDLQAAHRIPASPPGHEIYEGITQH
ncbi:hypothetical protein Tco_0801957 [Tanacetum coccineum]|uniref:Uncharacterized protein n=1 Tax=Tanacetum coccineum TaxID=301880 RepID=A0ABQ4ZXG6_9ASTR